MIPTPCQYIENCVTLVVTACFTAFLIWHFNSMWGLLGLLLLANLNGWRS
jgi:hypothetical protein